MMAYRPLKMASLVYERETTIVASAPGDFWPTRFPFTRWCPAQGNLRDTSLIHSQYVAQPSDSSAFDFHNNALATRFSVQVPIRDLIWPEDATDFFGDTHCGRTQVCSCQT